MYIRTKEQYMALVCSFIFTLVRKIIHPLTNFNQEKVISKIYHDEFK